MRIRSLIGYVVVFALAVSALALVGCAQVAMQKDPIKGAVVPPPDTASPFAVGQTVAAKWTDGNLWLAKVTSVTGDQIKVEFTDDHSTLSVPVADVHAVTEKTWGVGSDVLAVWTAGRFYPGQITAADGGTYTVKWEDGSTPSKVTSDKIISVP